VGLAELGQQFDVGPRLARLEAMPEVDSLPHLAAGRVAGDQPRHLLPAATRHLLDVAPKQTPTSPALCGIAMLNQHRLHPDIHLPPVLAL